MLAPQAHIGALTAIGMSILAGCAYQADSFSYSREQFHGHQVTVGCLDLAIERRADLPTGDAVVGYEFGNRCDQPAVVDLASVGIIGRTADGHAIELVAFDPRREIRPSQIDGRAVGREAIAYSSSIAIDSVCIDAASIARATPPRWLCFHDD